MKLGKTLLVAVLAMEGFLLLRPDGALVRAARQEEPRTTNQARDWWWNSPVHMGCSILSCTRPAVRTATYRQPGPRGVTWRAYGFCEKHDPPESLAGLVYRIGLPPRPGYDVPLTPLWTEVYFLLGIFAFGTWCACMWRYAVSRTSAPAWVVLLLLQGSIVTVLWKY